MDYSVIAQMLRSYRKHKNLTQPQLGDKLGKIQNGISQLENGRCFQFDKMFDLANTLNIGIKIEFTDKENNDTFLTISK